MPEVSTHDIYWLVYGGFVNLTLQWSVRESAAIRLWNTYIAT